MNKSFLYKFINKGHERSINAKKNIIASFFIKGCCIAISLMLVPLTINYINPTRYGIWLTLSSIIGWLSFFDIGFGNGLRNKFAEAKAAGKIELARIYVSTTYAIVAIIIGTALVLFLCINPFLNWSKILNTPLSMASELNMLALVIFFFFCMQLILQLITTIIISDQKPANASLLNLLGSAFSLLTIYILTKTTTGNLLYLGIAMGLTPILVLFISSLWLYNGEYKYYVPSFKFVKFSYAKQLSSVGIQFFIIQIAGIIIFSTDNVIISNLFGAGEVTSYNIAYKYFGVINLIFSIICVPFWSSSTEAFYKKDFNWIKNIIKKLSQIWLLFVFASVFLLYMAPVFYHYWIPRKINIPFRLSLFMCLYVCIITWGTIFVTFINGVGKIKLQLYFSIIAGIVNIPMSILFAKTFNLGASGVILATTICLSYGPFLSFFQYKKIINGTANGIWNK